MSAKVRIGALFGIALAVAAAAGAGGARSSATPNIYTIAGIGNPGGFGNAGEGGQATEAQINRPRSIWAVPGGGYVFAEPFSNSVYLVQSDGTLRRLAGTGTAGFSGDGGPATAAQLTFVHGVAKFPGGGNVLADESHN